MKFVDEYRDGRLARAIVRDIERMLGRFGYLHDGRLTDKEAPAFFVKFLGEVGQVIQADIGSITPDDLRHYPLGSVLNGGNSWPNDDKLAAASEWLRLADRFYQASTGGGGIAVLWGTDAVHGHDHIVGATLLLAKR